jgi:hypothetical protein
MKDWNKELDKACEHLHLEIDAKREKQRDIDKVKGLMEIYKETGNFIYDADSVLKWPDLKEGEIAHFDGEKFTIMKGEMPYKNMLISVAGPFIKDTYFKPMKNKGPHPDHPEYTIYE